jgi:hypothetical protein
MLIEGQWAAQDGGSYILKVGNLFIAEVRQRGGDGIYAKCWIVTVNKHFVAETGDDVLYAKAWAEKFICEELDRVKATYHQLRPRVPPVECFHGPDTLSNWRNWKQDNLDRWSLNRDLDVLPIGMTDL